MLSIDYNELQKSIGRYLGYGRNICGPDNDSEEWADIEDCIKSGLRQFYTPPVLPGQQIPHQWSFLKPTTTIAIEAETKDYDMPADFGGIIGDLTYPASVSRSCVSIVHEASIRKIRQSNPQTGNPTRAGIRPKSTDGSAAQKWEIMFWPTPDTDVDLSYKYFVLPTVLSNDNPYPYGGMVHSETILQSCLAMAEQRLNDEQGIHWNKFMERIMASIQHDRKIGSADFFGYNGDSSDRTSHPSDRCTEVKFKDEAID